MKTLKELVIDKKCRKGPSDGITKSGAYWLAIPPVMLRKFGGSGFGNESSEKEIYLELRHYRSGEVKALLVFNSWHQNYGGESEIRDATDLLDCRTIEDVIVKLKGIKIRECSVYCGNENLVLALKGICMATCEISPDESEHEKPVTQREKVLMLIASFGNELEEYFNDKSVPHENYAMDIDKKLKILHDDIAAELDDYNYND